MTRNPIKGRPAEQFVIGKPTQSQAPAFRPSQADRVLMRVGTKPVPTLPG